MNVVAQTNQTAAESAFVESFAGRVSELPGDASVVVKRDEALEALKAGLPTRKIEAWHYTDLRRLLSQVPAFKLVSEAAAVAPLVDSVAVLPVLNGAASRSLPTIGDVSIETVADKLVDGALSEQLAPAGPHDTVGAINAAFVSDGYWLDIAAGAALEKPVEIQNVHAGGQTHSRFSVRAGAGSRATVVERQTGTEEALVSSISHVDVGDDAEVLWIVLQEQLGTVSHLGQFTATIGRNAKLTLFVMNAGGKLVRQEVRVTAAGEGSQFLLRGVNLLAGDSHCDVTMVLDHPAPDTYSTETLRNVVTDRANGVFQGQIRVASEAQKTDAKMSCNTLLLSDEGGFSAKPELEIFADDVACGHGATVTEIEQDHLFYLMARGIEEKTARGLLVKAFVAEMIEELEDEAIIEALEGKLAAWFATHG